MTPNELRDFLASYNLSQTTIAKRLEMSRTTIGHYLAGRWPIPEVFAMALKGYALELQEARRKARDGY